MKECDKETRGSRNGEILEVGAATLFGLPSRYVCGIENLSLARHSPHFLHLCPLV